jgi:hypothetical protein
VSCTFLDGRAGPGSETVQVGLTRSPVVHPNWLWRWAYEVEKERDVLVRRRRQEEKRTLRMSWRGFGFGTGKEEQENRVLKVKVLGIDALMAWEKPSSPIQVGAG